MFLARLPQIQDELEKSLMITRDALLQLPKKPSDEPQAEISSLLHEFTSNVARHVEGVPTGDLAPFSGSNGRNAKGLIQSINAAQEKFRISIRVTAPNFRPFEKKDAKRRHLGPTSFLEHEEGDEFEDCTSDKGDENVNEGEGMLKTESKIYIDEVLEVALRSGCFISNLLFISHKTQFSYSRVARALPLCRADDVHQGYN